MHSRIEVCVKLALAGQLDEALTAIDELLKEPDVDLAYGYFTRGNILVQLGRHQEALLALRTAATHEVNNSSILYNLGIEELTVGNERRGREYLERAAQLGHTKASTVLASLQAGEPIAFHHGASKSAGAIIIAHVERGMACVAAGRYADALIEYDRAIALAPEVGHVHTLKGVAFEKLEQFDRAKASHLRAIEMDANNAVAHYNLGVAHERLGETQEAFEAYTRSLGLDRSDPETFYNRGTLLNMLGRCSEAIADFDEACRLKPDYALAYNNRGNAYNRLGQVELAMRDYTTAVTLEPDGPLFQFNKASCHLARGETDALKECVIALLKAIDRGDEMAVDLLERLSGRRIDASEIAKYRS